MVSSVVRRRSYRTSRYRARGRNLYGVVRTVANSITPSTVRNLGRTVRSAYNRYRGRQSTRKPRRKARKIEDQHEAVQHHSGISANTIRIYRKKHKLSKGQRWLGVWRYQQEHKGNINGSAGRQSVGEWASVCSRDQLLTSTGVGYNNFQNNRSIIDGNPYRNITGSNTFAVGAQPQNDRFFLTSAQMKCEFTNMSGVASIIDVYVCTPRDVTTVNPSAAMTNGFNYDDIGIPPATFPLPGAVSTNDIGGFTSDSVFVKPNDSSQFRSTWKICAVKSCKLEGGSTQLLHVDVQINKVIMQEKMLSHPSGSFIPNVSYVLLVVARGSIVRDENGTGSNGPPTFGSPNFAWIVGARTNARAVAGNAGRVNTSILSHRVTADVIPAQQAYLDVNDLPTTALATTQF